LRFGLVPGFRLAIAVLTSATVTFSPASARSMTSSSASGGVEGAASM